MSILCKRLMCVAVVLVAGLGLGRAAMSRFREQEDAFRKSCQEQLKAMGLTRQAAKAKFPTPEIGMVSSGCLLPGGTGEMVVKGKFAPGTKFFIENDSFTVVKESLTPAEYRATLKVADGIGPQTAALVAVSPVSCITAREDNAVTVGGKYEWNLEASNGWKIVGRSPAAKPCGSPGRRGDEAYELQFYKKGEAAPFETRTATLSYSQYEKTNHRFSISRDNTAAMPGMENFQQLMQKMSDPSVSVAERQQLMAQLQKAQAAMRANLKQMQDPAFVKQLEAKEQQFGCRSIEMEVAAAGAIAGRLRCAPAAGAQIPITGTMKFLGR